MMTTDPGLAVMKALDSGVRTQSTADLEEIGCRVQTSGNRGAGSGHNSQYWPVWAHIAQVEREAPGQASALHTLYAPTEEEANRWIDVMHERLVGITAGLIPKWSNLTPTKRDRAEWIAYAAIIARRSDLERCRPEWGPERISYYLAENHGISISTKHWKRDYLGFWEAATVALENMEQEALKPISAIIRKENEKCRNEMLIAA